MTHLRDRHGDYWTEGDDGLLHSAETAPFPREHVERKWGPLVEADPLVDLLARMLREHYAIGGWSPKAGIPGTPGRWACSCGAAGDVPNGTRVVAHHRQHVAERQAEALARRAAD